MIHQFDHRYAQFTESDPNGSAEPLSPVEHLDPFCFVQTRYWLPAEIQRERFPGRWFLVFRDITNGTNERTAIATIVPNYPCVNSVSLIEHLSARNAAMLCANMNSFIYDYFTRQKAAGVHLNHWIWKQLPVAAPHEYGPTTPLTVDDVIKHVLELIYTAWDLETFANDCGYDGPPFRWDKERRFLLRCELDAAYFHLYGIGRGDVDYIMETFPIVKRKDIQQHGDYRTKLVILHIYDAMQKAIKAGQPYQTLLNPLPAAPRVAHSPREVMP